MEIVIYLFASVGILYLLRDGALWLIYHRNRWGLYLQVPLARYDRKSFCDLLSALCELRESVIGKRLFRGIALCESKGASLSRAQAQWMARVYGIRLKQRRPRKIRGRFVRS